jgi:D-tyrosyl-tRNA(Tyr) deacylase
MKAVIQRVRNASVKIDGRETAAIGPGYLIFLGVVKGDNEAHADAVAGKCADLRIFEDDAGKMNLSIKDISGEALIVSQFTLAADCRRGRRPSFDAAADPKVAAALYKYFCEKMRAEGIPVKTGEFAAYMEVNIANDGPVTILLDSIELM